jgi:hypothetical protein
MNRDASVRFAEQLRGPIPEAEREALIGLNIRDTQRLVADVIGSRGKFVVVFSESREFVFGDGFFHNIKNSDLFPSSPKLFVPITPYMGLLLCCPPTYLAEPRLLTLVLGEQEVDACNSVIQVYAKEAVYFRSQQPELTDVFRRAAHLVYADRNNPIERIIQGIPGVLSPSSDLDHISAFDVICGGPSYFL